MLWPLVMLYRARHAMKLYKTSKKKSVRIGRQAAFCRNAVVLLPFTAWLVHVTTKPEKRRYHRTVNSDNTFVVNEHVADYSLPLQCTWYVGQQTSQRQLGLAGLQFPRSLRPRYTHGGHAQPHQRSVTLAGGRDERSGCTGNF